ncbi:MAG: hypothetical protein AB7W28_07430 [Armatimonadota bacterium]
MVTVRDFYEGAIAVGMRNDLRGEEALRRQLEHRREEYESLSGRERLMYDAERLRNPFGDTRLVAGDPDREIRRVMVGIDIDVAEVALAQALASVGRPVDLIVAHHASAIGGAVRSVEDTMNMQIAMMARVGVPEEHARKLVEAEYASRGIATNYRVTQAAEATGIALMTVHGPADASVHRYFDELLARRAPATVGALVDLCDGEPEVDWFVRRGLATEIVVGDRDAPLGLVYNGFFGGWLASPLCFKALCDAGIGTFISVATTNEHNEIGRQHRVNVLVVPHHAFDDIGMNLVFDELLPSDVDYVEVGNFVRVNRNQQGPPS